MTDRKKLHEMVDALPDEALELTFRVLENYQRTLPMHRADAEQVFEEARERFKARLAEPAQKTGKGVIGGFGGTSRFGSDGYGGSATRGWEVDNTFVIESVHFFRGHELQTTERLRLSDDQQKIVLSVEAKVPNGSSERHDFSFDASQAGS